MKFAAVAILLACVALASAHTIHVQRNLIEDVIRGILENKRPSLTNLTVENVNFGEWGSLSNLQLHNAENFVIEELKTEGPFSTNIANITLSLLNADATSQFVAHDIDIPEIGAHINGAGDLVGEITNGWITMSMKNKLQGTSVTVTDISNYALNVATITAKLTGIDNEDQNNAAINAGIRDFVVANFEKFVTDNKEMILELLNKAING